MSTNLSDAMMLVLMFQVLVRGAIFVDVVRDRTSRYRLPGEGEI